MKELTHSWTSRNIDGVDYAVLTTKFADRVKMQRYTKDSLLLAIRDLDAHRENGSFMGDYFETRHLFLEGLSILYMEEE